MDNISEEIKKFVNEIRGVYAFDFTKDTKLQEDLNIWGDDAVEFINNFGGNFNIDISEFDINKYFKSEGDMILSSIVNLFRKTKPPESIPLTLGDLEQAIRNGKLI